MECAITGVDKVIDDCHVTIEFGYGSSKDLHTYQFSPITERSGVDILDYIQKVLDENGTGKSIEDFRTDKRTDHQSGRGSFKKF